MDTVDVEQRRRETDGQVTRRHLRHVIQRYVWTSFSTTLLESRPLIVLKYNTTESQDLFKYFVKYVKYVIISR